MTHLGCHPNGPRPLRSAFVIRYGRHLSVKHTLSLLASLEGNTEAYAIVAVHRTIAVALSRTQVLPNEAPGTTPMDPRRARGRSSRIDHRIAGRISLLVPVRGPLKDISMHIEKAPRVGRILTHIGRMTDVLFIIGIA